MALEVEANDVRCAEVCDLVRQPAPAVAKKGVLWPPRRRKGLLGKGVAYAAPA